MNRCKHVLYALAFLMICSVTQAQVGGQHIYEFLRLPVSSRTAALGGNVISYADEDANFAFDNPALLQEEMHQSLSFSHSFYLNEIQHGYVHYAHRSQAWNTVLHGGIKYVNYGTFDRTDPQGNRNGTFEANDYALTVGASREIYDRLQVGANLRMINSQLENFASTGMSVDLGAYYNVDSSRFSIGFVLQNIGGQLSAYTPGMRESIPFEIQLAVSKRLQHLPFRFTVLAHHLERWDVTYDDPADQQEDNVFGFEPIENEGYTFLDNLFRHLVFSGEFYIGQHDNFRLRLSYNHFRKQELSLENYRSLAGFSGGVGFKVANFRVDYALSQFHTGEATHHFTLSTNLSTFSSNPLPGE